MSPFQDALRNTLNELSPSSIIREGWVDIFHNFFARGTQDDFIQFKPPRFQSKHPYLPEHPQAIPVIPCASQNVPLSIPTIVAYGPKPSSLEPTTSNSCRKLRPRQQRRPIDLRVSTPKSFESQKNPDPQPSTKAWKLIKCVENVADKGIRDLEFYKTLFDDPRGLPSQGHVSDPGRRYKTLQELVVESAKDEVKNVNRQRIAHILGAHELQVIDGSILPEELSKGVKRRTVTIEKMSKSSGIEVPIISAHNTRGRHYLSFYYGFGPGALPLLGDESNRDLLEHALKDTDVANAIWYIRMNCPNWLLLCEKLQFAVACSILKCLERSGWDRKSHHETIFIKHLRKFIDLGVFALTGKFRPVSRDDSGGASQPRGAAPQTHAETPGYGVPGDQSNRKRKRYRDSNPSFSAPDILASTGIEGNTSATEAISCPNVARTGYQQDDALFSPDAIVPDRPAGLKEPRPISDPPAEAERSEAFTERDQAFTIDALASSQSRTCVLIPKSSQSSDSMAEKSTADTHYSPSLHSQRTSDILAQTSDLEVSIEQDTDSAAEKASSAASDLFCPTFSQRSETPVTETLSVTSHDTRLNISEKALIFQQDQLFSQNHDTDQRAVPTEHRPTNDLSPETEGLEASIERNQAPTTFQQGDCLGLRPSQGSKTTIANENSNPNPHGAHLQNQSLGPLLVNRDQTRKLGQMASVDNVAEARLHSLKRRRALPSYSRGLGEPATPDTQLYADAPGSTLSRGSVTNTDFRTVVNDGTIGEATPHNEPSPISNASNVLYGKSAMSQQHVQGFAHFNERDELREFSPVQPSPPNASYVFSPKGPARILSSMVPSESLDQDSATAEIHLSALDNWDLDWEKFDWDQVQLPPAPDDLDHGWERFLDHGWEQSAQDLGLRFGADTSDVST